MTPSDLYTTLEATWPAARSFRSGPWLLREGLGGGKRVSAATAEDTVGPADLAALEVAQAALGQRALVMVRDGEEALDALLGRAGYAVVDPVLAYAAPIERLVEGPGPRPKAFAAWPSLAIFDEIWENGGIGPARRAVMNRVQGPKTAVLGRIGDRVSGVGFVALHDKSAMIHAIEVSAALRRQGAGRKILRAAAAWSQDIGATTFSLVVTERNIAARALYASLAMDVVGHYHYRMK